MIQHKQQRASIVHLMFFVVGLALLTACRAAPTPNVLSPTLPATPIITLPPPHLAQTDNLIEPTTTPIPPTPMVTSTPLIPIPPLLPTATPLPAKEWLLGHSTQGQPLITQRVGTGSLSIAIVGYHHPLAHDLWTYFADNPHLVPASLSLWFLPNMSPDGVNRAVDIRRNANTNLDSCRGNEWQADPNDRPHAGGAYPFSEPESVALEQLLQSTWLTIFLEQADSQALLEPRLVPAGCRDFKPSLLLMETLAQATNMPTARAQSDSGNWIDYLSGEGIASARVALPANNVHIETQIAGMQAVFNNIDAILSADGQQAGVNITWLDQANTGQWQYPEHTFIHPLALATRNQTMYILDGGRVWLLDLQQPEPPQLLLQPGDYVTNEWVNVPALEPLDLTTNSTDLLVLDRSGDVYRYDAGNWYAERYDRPIQETSSHYFIALTTNAQGDRYLLENSYQYINTYQAPYNGDTRWLLEDVYQVDVDVYDNTVFFLYQNKSVPTGGLVRYNRALDTTAQDKIFRARVPLFRPRAMQATANAIYILDHAGNRLLVLDYNGFLQQIFQFRQKQTISAFWVDPTTNRLILAGADTLYFVNEPQQQATITTPSQTQSPPFFHEETNLYNLRGLLTPITGSPITTRDLQMPGAPRHYRFGIHEGVDFYWSAGTTIRAVDDGTVIRANHDFIPPTAAQIAAWREASFAVGFTPPDALDGFRGRQVWLEHANGIVSRYVHLSAIAPDVIEGVTVSRGQLLGYVGNSGSPSSIINGDEDAHLHFELWLNGQYLGQFLRPIEIREWLERILAP